jgi:hypothetical protein
MKAATPDFTGEEPWNESECLHYNRLHKLKLVN